MTGRDDWRWGTDPGPDDRRTFRERPDPMPDVVFEEGEYAWWASRAGADHDMPCGSGPTPEAAQKDLIKKESAYYDN